MSGVIQFTLERDGHDQPWGFRLQGGHDVGLPLTIQRVLVGTPAEGVLRKGDIVCKVSYTDAKGLNHQQAADLFTNAGNQIQIYIRRPGATVVPSATAASTMMALSSPINSLDPETLLLQNLPKPRSQTKSSAPSSPLSLTIQNQPYRTSPLIQPSAKLGLEIGPGSVSHLKMQSDYISGAKEAQPSPDSQQAKATEFVMKQKVTGTLQQIQNQPISNSVPLTTDRPHLSNPITASQVPVVAPMQSSQAKQPTKQFYNNPINLYSSENVNAVAKLNQMGISGGTVSAVYQSPDSPASPTGLINPVNKPSKHFFGKGGLPLKYDPEQSATWQAIREQEDCKLITEHGPKASKVYSI